MLYAIINKFFYGTYGDNDFKKALDLFKEYYDRDRRDFLF
jgi:hypothetical protein